MVFIIVIMFQTVLNFRVRIKCFVATNHITEQLVAAVLIAGDIGVAALIAIIKQFIVIFTVPINEEQFRFSVHLYVDFTVCNTFVTAIAVILGG